MIFVKLILDGNLNKINSIRSPSLRHSFSYRLEEGKQVFRGGGCSVANCSLILNEMVIE